MLLDENLAKYESAPAGSAGGGASHARFAMRFGDSAAPTFHVAQAGERGGAWFFMGFDLESSSFVYSPIANLERSFCAVLMSNC